VTTWEAVATVEEEDKAEEVEGEEHRTNRERLFKGGLDLDKLIFLFCFAVLKPIY